MVFNGKSLRCLSICCVAIAAVLCVPPHDQHSNYMCIAQSKRKWTQWIVVQHASNGRDAFENEEMFGNTCHWDSVQSIHFGIDCRSFGTKSKSVIAWSFVWQNKIDYKKSLFSAVYRLNWDSTLYKSFHRAQTQCSKRKNKAIFVSLQWHFYLITLKHKSSSDFWRYIFQTNKKMLFIICEIA